MSVSVADAVEIVFSTKGFAEVLKTIESINAAMARFEKSAARESKSGAAARTKSSSSERSGREREMAALAKTAAKWERESAKEAERAAKAKSAVETKAAKDRARIVENSAKAAGRVAVQAASVEIREAERANKSIARIRENSASMAGKLADKQAREEAAAAARSARAIARIRDNSANMAGRFAAKQSAEEAAARRQQANGGGRVGGIISGAVGRTLGGIAAVGAGALALGGGFSLADSLRNEMGAQKAAIGLTQALPAGQAPVSATALMNRAKAIQAATNISKGDVIEGMHAYVAKTGDGSILAEGDNTLMDLAKLAKGTGTNYADMLASAGLMKAQNKALTGGGLVDMMRVAAAQGMTGAVELSDLAKIGGKITASRGAYSTDQTSAQRQLLGLAQIAYPTAGSADEAATVVTRFSADALAHTKQLGALGLVDKNGNLANPDQVVSKVLGATGGNLGKIHEQYGFNKESIKLFEQLSPGYREALAANGGDRKKAEAAISKQITDVTGVSMTGKEVDSKVAAVLAGDEEKLAHAMNEFSEMLATKGIPYLERFIAKLPEMMPQFERLVEGAAKVADVLIENPLKGIGALIAANVTADLSKAAIGQSMSKMFQGFVGGMAPATAAAWGSVPAIAAMSAAAIAAGVALIDHVSGKAIDASKDDISADVKTHSMILQHKRGIVSDEDLQKQIAANDERLDVNNRGIFEGFNGNREAQASLASENQKAKDELAAKRNNIAEQQLAVARETLEALKGGGGAVAVNTPKPSPGLSVPLAGRTEHN